MQVRLPYPPSINHYYGRTRGGQVFLTKSARAFRRQVAVLLYGAKKFGKARLAIRVDLFPPRVNCDADNPLKALLDALQHAGTFNDDRQVKDLRIVWRHAVRDGAVEVKLWEF